MSLLHDFDHYNQHGWCSYAASAELLDWVKHAKPVASQIVENPSNRHWWRHGKTWFAGVNILPNDAQGKLAGSKPLDVQLCDWIKALTAIEEGTDIAWEPGQLSVLRPGYPLRDAHESAAAHRFRRNRDAAHVDGLLPVGEARRRMPREFHRFILGIPLQPIAAHAGATVVWEGSHHLMQSTFVSALQSVPEHLWPQTDLTELYQQTRRKVFACCKRVEITVPQGGCYLIHRFALHGVAPWVERDADAGLQRSVVFFRPEVGDRQSWLTGP